MKASHLRQILAHARSGSKSSHKATAPPEPSTQDPRPSNDNVPLICERIPVANILVSTCCLDPELAPIVSPLPQNVAPAESEEQRRQRFARVNAIARLDQDTFREHVRNSELKRVRRLTPIRPPTGMSRLTFLRLQREEEERRLLSRRQYDAAAE